MSHAEFVKKSDRLSWPWAGRRMPNALILEYQKSVVRHAPSRLYKGSCATGVDLETFDDTTVCMRPNLLTGWALVD